MTMFLRVLRTCVLRINVQGMCRCAVLLGVLLISSVPAFARVVPDKTPDDVFQKVMELSQKIQWLRREKGVSEAWPSLSLRADKAPRHVLQKAQEVLLKINRYRLIKNMGPISTGHFPGRDITPNEVFAIVQRLNDEIDLLLPVAQRGPHPHPRAVFGRNSSDVYEILWEASRALDPVLGIRGFNPSDVYAQSLHVVELVIFLRQSQNLPDNIKIQKRKTGRHPNHALASVYRLQNKIAQAQKALWMDPISVPTVPRRVITPTEVYDATETVLAELQRIKYRLGLTRNFSTPKTVSGKTPDDVVQHIDWASQMMPMFSEGQTLVQYDNKKLKKTPNYVFAVTEHILSELRMYRDVKGITVNPRDPPLVNLLEPKHVLQKTLEAIEKTNRLRGQVGLGFVSSPRYPLREITPTEVYDLAIRLDEELEIPYEQVKMPHQLYYNIPAKKIYSNKTSSDVYRNMWRISLLLDTVLNTAGYTPDDVFREAEFAQNEMKIIADHFSGSSRIKILGKESNISRKQVFERARKVLDMVYKAHRRAGLFLADLPVISKNEKIMSSDVYNVVRLILAEMTTLKVQLGITKQATRPTQVKGKTPADAYQSLGRTILILEDVLKNGGGHK